MVIDEYEWEMRFVKWLNFIRYGGGKYISWKLIEEKLGCSLEEAYNTKSLKEISELTDGYVSDRTVAKRLKKLGVKMRNKGGSHLVRNTERNTN
jgi:hypothetical protein